MTVAADDPDDETAALLVALQWSARAADGTPCCAICGGDEPSGHRADCRLARAIAFRPRLTRWRHRKRRTLYRELGHATLQHSGGPLDDQAVMVVYRAETDGSLGVRALLEFSDGRFERLV